MHLQGHEAHEASETEVTLAVQSADPERHLRALRDWLAREDAFRGRLRLLDRPVRDGEMGGVLDVLAVSLGSGGAGALLVQALSAWLGQRGADVSVTVTAPDGREVTIDVRRTQDPLAVVREVERLTAPPRD
ncbi:hypothetical protein AB0I82_13240 [Streptomyces sp. NPDC050315]|uniref:effector-associated constant component EACC1 n=1 Tax=Streptomyces sp. NPDC050315 TaxID=3155039 RepID=UPI00343190EB